MKTRRAWVTAVIACLLIGVPILFQLISSAFENRHIYHHEIGAAPVAGMTEVPDGTLTELAGFETNLPIVVMDVGGKPFRKPTEWDTEKGYRVSVEYDPYNEGILQVIDTGDTNRLTDDASLETHMKARIRGFSSLGYDKKQYQIKLLNEDGTKNRQDVLGMGEEWEWILNISYIDKSLLRNYLAYNIAAEIMGYAPEVRFCEVFIKDGDVYQYQGLYLFMERIKQGEDRVNITKYDPGFTESAYILRRDRYDEEAIILETHNNSDELASSYLSVRYPSDNEITSETVQFIEDDINEFERVLYSEDINEFLKYRDYIDIQSFVDFFIINEFFANYDANYYSVFMYKDIGGKLTMGPVWDFDGAVDNGYPHILKIDSTAMHDGVWFRQMLRDGEFVNLIIERYAELRKGLLSDDRLNKLTDDTVAFIRPAQQRDWNKWGYNEVYDRQYVATVDSVLRPLIANRWEYDEVIENLKFTLREHGSWMDESLDSLYQFSTIEPGHYRELEAEPVLNVIFGDDRLKWVAGTLSIMLLVIFFTSIVLIQRD